MRRRETGASGHQRVWPTWAPSHFMCAEFHFVATTKTTTATTTRAAAKRGTKQNKLKSSQSPNLIYALYAHKNVKNCVAPAAAPAPYTYPPALTSTRGDSVCDALSGPVSSLLCWTWTWAAERMRAYFALIGKRSHHQHHRGTANDDAKCAQHTHIGGPAYPPEDPLPSCLLPCAVSNAFV